MESPGQLKNREDRKLYNTDKESTLYKPQTSFYSNLAEECVQSGVSVEMFVCPNMYIDVATLSTLASSTGGEIHRYPSFKAQVDGERLVQDLLHSVQRQTAYDAVMRVRCSTGLRATDFWGNFFMSNTTDVQLGSIDCDKAVAVEIKYDDKLGEENSTAYIQAALLYTTVGGQRRLRIHNLALNCTARCPEVFRCAEMDTIMNVFCKKAVKKLSVSPFKSIRTHLLEQIVSLLTCYRKHCAQPSTAAQLILPEVLKLLPLYVCSMLKCDAIRAQNDVSVDDKSWLMHFVQFMPLTISTAYLYPRILPLHDLSPEQTDFPQRVRCYYDALSADGAYLLENGVVMVLWISRNINPRWLTEVLGVHSLGEINTDMFHQLPVIENPMSKRVRNIVNTIRAERPHHMKLMVVLQGQKSEPLFRRYLCEDTHIDGSSSYVDLLCYVHKEIRNQLTQ